MSLHLIAGCKDSGDTVLVGVLHSLTGTMAVSEIALRDAILMAIEEINDRGGLLGKRLVPVVRDGASEADVFRQEAEQLLQRERVAVVFGCWTSRSRRAVLPIFERERKLLFYPVQYEGLEASPYIVYTGATPMQQIVPAVRWLLAQGKRRIFLVGSDYIFPHTAHHLIRSMLATEGGTLLGEVYRPLGHIDFLPIIWQIKALQLDVVINTLNGDSNVAFFKQLRSTASTAEVLPVMSFSVAEEEIQGIGVENIVGHYMAWNYFMSLDIPQNRRFKERYLARCGTNCVTDDPIQAAYTGVLFWAAAVAAAHSFESEAVRRQLRGLTIDTPAGNVTIASASNHTIKTAYIGRVREDGQFDIVWGSERPIMPEPYLESELPHWAAEP